MAYQYTISKGNQKLSMFQNEEYIDLNLKDIELFCEDYICQNFESRTKEETLFRDYLMLFLSREQEKVLSTIEQAWQEKQQPYLGIIAFYSHDMVGAKKMMSLKNENKNRVRCLLDEYIGTEDCEKLKLPKKYILLKNKYCKTS